MSLPSTLLGYARTVWRTQRGADDLPRLLTHIVTFTCNARCVMCDSWKKEGEGDLTLEEIARIYRELPQLDAVRLTGGEPFVRKDLPSIVELARRELRPLVMHITSNGFLTDRIVRFCEARERAMPLQLMISVDGVGAKHDEVRGIRRAFERVMATLEALAPRQDALGLRLAVNQTIVDAEGVEHYRRLRERLRPLGVRHQMVMAYDASATYSTEREVDVAPTEIGEFATFGDFGREDLRALLAEVEADVAKLPLPERLAKRYYLDGIRSRLLGEREDHLSPRCVALGAHLRLFPNGDVPTCQFNTKVVGNLRERSFAELWRAAATRRQREWVRACPGCWAECEVFPNALYGGDLWRHAVAGKGRRVRREASGGGGGGGRADGKRGLPLVDAAE